MKLLHLADLHLGKRVNGFSMLDDQRYILSQIIACVDAEQPQAVLIAGDVYDRAVPSEEAVSLFDDFLVQLAQRRLNVFIISGNHDSAERVAFGGRLMESSGIHFSPVYQGSVPPIVLHDEIGEVAFYLIPFLKPVQVRRFFPETSIANDTTAMQMVVDNLELDSTRRNVAVAHQFVRGAALSGSEELAIGGLDVVDASVFAPFDYVALGHLHGAQRAGAEWIRYAGSPLKYSIAERNQAKSVTVIELGQKGQIDVRLLALHPKRDVRQFTGLFDEMMARTQVCDDYCEIILTDEQDIPNALSRLRALYPNLMHMAYDNTRTRTQSTVWDTGVMQTNPTDLFEEFYIAQNGQPMSSQQRAYINQLIAEIWEEPECDPSN